MKLSTARHGFEGFLNRSCYLGMVGVVDSAVVCRWIATALALVAVLTSFQCLAHPLESAASDQRPQVMQLGNGWPLRMLVATEVEKPIVNGPHEVSIGLASLGGPSEPQAQHPSDDGSKEDADHGPKIDHIVKRVKHELSLYVLLLAVVTAVGVVLLSLLLASVVDGVLAVAEHFKQRLRPSVRVPSPAEVPVARPSEPVRSPEDMADMLVRGLGRDGALVHVQRVRAALDQRTIERLVVGGMTLDALIEASASDYQRLDKIELRVSGSVQRN